MSNPNFVQKQFNFSANHVQFQIKSGTNSVHKKQKPISYLKSEFLYDSFYGKDRCNIRPHLWRYLLYYNENEMSTKFNRNFSAILPKPFRRKKTISDLIHEIFKISDKHIQSQRNLQSIGISLTILLYHSLIPKSIPNLVHEKWKKSAFVYDLFTNHGFVPGFCVFDDTFSTIPLYHRRHSMSNPNLSQFRLKNVSNSSRF